MNHTSFNWHLFWKEYRNIDYKNEDDLFVQVGKTINGIPISKSVFMEMIEDIVKNLEIESNDVLLEMCCGNGLLTTPLSEFVAEVYAFDFTMHLIETAIQFRKNNKITYKIADANEDFFAEFDFKNKSNKYLMNDSLGYFSPDQLKLIIQRIIQHSYKFRFYITGVPNNDLKWNFYNTEERKQEYLRSINSGEVSGKGIGYWWDMKEINNIATQLGLNCTISNQPNTISNYRTNVLLWN